MTSPKRDWSFKWLALTSSTIALSTSSEFFAHGFSTPASVGRSIKHGNPPFSYAFTSTLVPLSSTARFSSKKDRHVDNDDLASNAAMGAAAETEDPATVAVKQTFSKFDKDKSGGLDPWELRDALNYLDYEVSVPTAMLLMQEFDNDQNKQLEMNEFINLVMDKVPQDTCATFSVFANDEGFLGPGALRQALSFLAIDKNSKQSKAILESFDANNDGRLGLLGFSKLVSKLNVAKFWLTVDPSGRIRQVRKKILKKLVQAPKKKVSTHSILASISFGMILLSCSLIWSPGVNEFGVFHFTDLFRTFSRNEETIITMTSILSVIVAFTGRFRIPPNSPACRRLMFDYSAYVIASSTAILLSNIGGMASYAFDAWSPSGRVLILMPVISMFLSVFRMLGDSIAGPMKGRETVPMMTTRPTAFFTSIALVFTAYFQVVQHLTPLLTTKTVASTWNKGMNVSIILFSGIISSSLVTLAPTLRFTNKVGNTGCLAFILAAIVGTGALDLYLSAFRLATMFKGHPEYLATMNSMMGLLNNSGVNELIIGGTVLTMINAFRRKFKTKEMEVEEA
mmetsp:Transcript_9868/g.17281  ORF Transcript_9868/g.17281 Transcript_9868/m.17281 type:complete len:567 (+) Transcript_9868:95-1795(+)